ncbi:MAG TPA: BTAD domain-containing putative transcriptional regulator, partial [Nitrolancea sp.]|nr:BTAD domain-containing putative transcriptional regulator [Nitrolancea sp.]
MPQQATRAIAKPANIANPFEAKSVESDPISRATPTDPAPPLRLESFVVDQPLSSYFSIPSTISRIVMEADRDIARGRFESALDLTLLAEVDEPGCVALFVRQAELLLASGRPDAAVQIVTAIETSPEASEGSTILVELERIMTHARPTDDNVIQLVQTALNARRIDLIDRYMPVAIDTASRKRDGALAVEFAQSWLEIHPDNLAAAFIFTREMLRSGQTDDAANILATLPESAGDLRPSIIRLVLDSVNDSGKQWDALATILYGIESKKFDAAQAQALLGEMISVQPNNDVLLVHRGVLEVHAGNPETALQLLQAVRPNDPSVNFVARVASARAATAAGNVASAVDALNQSIQLFTQPGVVEFAASCPVLRSPYDMYSIGRAIAGALQQRGDATEAATLLERLTILAPNRQDLARAYADALAKSGNRELALSQLEEMLRKSEERGEFEGLQLTIQAILQISPGNLRMRSRLIDEFMKRGLLQEAVQERWTQAQILERAGRVDDAIEQLRRASDVSSVLGDWKKLESIMRLMIRIRPDDMDVRHSAATKFIEFGQIQLAIEQLWGVVEVSSRQNNPDDTIAALHQI